MKHEWTEYPPKPENPTGEFLNRYSYEKPVEFLGWHWSNTFNRWSALVTFADGWHGYTYPKQSSGGLIIHST